MIRKAGKARDGFSRLNTYKGTFTRKLPYNIPKRGDFFHVSDRNYLCKNAGLFIDLRDPAAYRRGHVRNAANIPYRELEEYLEKKQDQKYRFPKDKLLILYCDRGGASMQAARSLARQGCRTRSVIGGFAAYRGRNLVRG